MLSATVTQWQTHKVPRGYNLKLVAVIELDDSQLLPSCHPAYPSGPASLNHRVWTPVWWRAQLPTVLRLSFHTDNVPSTEHSLT